MRSASVSLLFFACLMGTLTGQTINPHPDAHQQASSPSDQQKLDAMLDELRQIHALLAEQNKLMNQRTAAQVPAPTPVMEKVSLALGSGWYSMGSDSAPVTVMEFADFQCPYCRKFHTDSFAQLKKNYIDTGKVRFISRDLPLEFHDHAMTAALAARCAGEQNKYWELRDTLITNSKDLARESIAKYAQSVGLDMPRFNSCLDAEKYKTAIVSDRDEANKLGFSGTPSFVIGKVEADKLDGVKIVGALPYSAFDGKIHEFLAGQ